MKAVLLLIMLFKRSIFGMVIGFAMMAGAGCQVPAIVENIGGKSPQQTGPANGVEYSGNVPVAPDPTAARRSPTAQNPP
jgi:hypothetical protein